MARAWERIKSSPPKQWRATSRDEQARYIEVSGVLGAPVMVSLVTSHRRWIQYSLPAYQTRGLKIG